MKFVSTNVQPRRRIAVQDVTEINVNGRNLLVATGQGHLMGSDVQLEADAAALEHLTLLAQLTDPPLQVVHAEIDSVELASRQMAQVFDVLPDGGAVMFLCRTQAAREAAEDLLAAHRATEPLTRH